MAVVTVTLDGGFFDRPVHSLDLAVRPIDFIGVRRRRNALMDRPCSISPFFEDWNTNSTIILGASTNQSVTNEIEFNRLFIEFELPKLPAMA